MAKTYTKTHKSKKAADGHAIKIRKRGGKVTRTGNKLTYSFVEKKQPREQKKQRMQQQKHKSFTTLNAAVKYLDKKYTRDGWLHKDTGETIHIHGITTWVEDGLRVDPGTDKEYEYVRKIEGKYPNYNIRLS